MITPSFKKLGIRYPNIRSSFLKSSAFDRISTPSGQLNPSAWRPSRGSEWPLGESTLEACDPISQQSLFERLPEQSIPPPSSDTR